MPDTKTSVRWEQFDKPALIKAFKAAGGDVVESVRTRGRSPCRSIPHKLHRQDQSNRNEETTMQNATPLVSRRNLLTGIVAAPTLAAAAGATLAHAKDIDAAAARAKAALKSAKGTKLVLLGTGSGPIPGLARRMASNLIFSQLQRMSLIGPDHRMLQRTGYIRLLPHRVGSPPSIDACRPKDWANESLTIVEATTTEYCLRNALSCELPPGSVAIDAAYVSANVPILREQLAKAGVRLAHLLETALNR
jgi:hypothetical protein